VNYLIRSAIQTGCLATAWAIAGLVTFFFLPKMAAYRIIDLTSGTVYTHVRGFVFSSWFHFSILRETYLRRFLRPLFRAPSCASEWQRQPLMGWDGPHRCDGTSPLEIRQF
jgi:hypothetical protein